MDMIFFVSSLHMGKRLKITLGIVGGLVVMFTVLWMWPFGRFILTGGLGDLDEKPFDKQQWTEAKHSTEPLALRSRLLMVDDLMNNHLKKGLDSVAVKDMLGEPERQYGFSYSIGMLTEGMDAMFLIVAFDSTGRATAYQIKTEESLQGKDDAAIRIDLQKD
jgi:hypothetical protein